MKPRARTLLERFPRPSKLICRVFLDGSATRERRAWGTRTARGGRVRGGRARFQPLRSMGVCEIVSLSTWGGLP
jgi:hypothetical protein